MKSLITLFLILFLSSCNSQNPFYLASTDSQCSHINSLYNEHLNCVKRKFHEVPCHLFFTDDFEFGLRLGKEAGQQCQRELNFPDLGAQAGPQALKCLGGMKGIVDKGANMMDDRLRSCY